MRRNPEALKREEKRIENLKHRSRQFDSDSEPTTRSARKAEEKKIEHGEAFLDDTYSVSKQRMTGRSTE